MSEQQPTLCFTCLSNTGERRISPGKTIYEGQHWLVEHAYPCGLVGWLVIVLRRHAQALHELTVGDMLKVSAEEAVPPEQIAAFCEQMSNLDDAR